MIGGTDIRADGRNGSRDGGDVRGYICTDCKAIGDVMVGMIDSTVTIANGIRDGGGDVRGHTCTIRSYGRCDVYLELLLLLLVAVVMVSMAVKTIPRKCC